MSRRFARAVGRLDAHREVLARYEQRLEEIRRARATVIDAPIVLLQSRVEELFVYGAEYFQSRLVADLGGTFAPIVAEVPPREVPLLPVSAEELDRVLDGAEGAFLVLNTDEERAALDANPLWAESRIARAGRFVTADFYTNSGRPITAMGVLDLLDALYAAMEAQTL